jgi:hypothetical protein
MGCRPERKRNDMSNPWTKKNPLMSMWLSSANRARGQATNVARQQVAATQAEAMRQVFDFWAGKPLKAGTRKKTRR